jgi:hypothetical protein
MFRAAYREGHPREAGRDLGIPFASCVALGLEEALEAP